MESIKEMVDVNTVVGDPVETSDGSTVIIPVSRVSCGFAAGGGEYEVRPPDEKSQSGKIPFGGGSGAGVSVQPMGFLVVGQNQVRLLPVEGNLVVDRLIDVAPQILSQIQSMFHKDHKEKKQSVSQGNCPM